jgi:hypothetical protein
MSPRIPVSSNAGLSPQRRLLIGIFTLIMAATGFAAGRTMLVPSRRVTQPIQFNHQKHVKEAGVECPSCHQYFETSEHSGLPALETCEGCHAEALTKSTEEARLLTLLAGRDRPPFRKLFRLPDHVYYSHRRHVVLGELTCETCHGAIADSTVPPAVPLKRLTMDGCIDCHAERGVSTDCTQCHR